MRAKKWGEDQMISAPVTMISSYYDLLCACLRSITPDIDE